MWTQAPLRDPTRAEHVGAPVWVVGAAVEELEVRKPTQVHVHSSRPSRCYQERP